MEIKLILHLISGYLMFCTLVWIYLTNSLFWSGILGNHKTILFVSLFSPILITVLLLFFVLHLIFGNDGES